MNRYSQTEPNIWPRIRLYFFGRVGGLGVGEEGGSHQQMEQWPQGRFKMNGEKSSAPWRHAVPLRDPPPPYSPHNPLNIITVT